MTFDKWFVEYNKQHGLPPAHIVAEAAWNAALDAANKALHDNATRLVPTRRLLEALKTPLEGSNEG